jgi:DNA repair exonuclease SbcCD nuclease subunit
LPDHEGWATLQALFPDTLPAIRQIIVADIHLVQTSCGVHVPLYEYSGERDHAWKWAEKKGHDGIIAYRAEKNVKSIDGLPTELGAH